MSVRRTLRMEDYLNTQFEEFMDLYKNLFGDELVVNSVICSLILKGMIQDLNQLSILFSENNEFTNCEDKEKIDNLRAKYKNLLNNLELYKSSK